MKKVLIIAYHFPPSNEVAIHRVLRMGKWLPEYGWIPYILTIKNGFFYRFSETNNNVEKKYFKNVFRVSSFIEKLIVKRGYLYKKNISGKFVRFILNMILIPDRYAFWYKPAVLMGQQIIYKEKIDVIWSTLNPYTSGLVGAALQRKTGIPLLIDYRDPWTLSQFHKEYFIKQKINSRLERRMLKVTSAIVTTSEPMRQLFISNKFFAKDKAFVITNCVDEELQFIEKNDEIVLLDKNKINITHTGSFYKDRQPFSFIEGIAELLLNIPEYKNKIAVNFVGNMNNKDLITFCRQHNVLDVFNFIDTVTYKKSMKYLLESDILLLFNGVADTNKIFIPGKLFDYLVVRKPVLFIGNEGAPVEIVQNCNIGEWCAHDKFAIETSLLKIMDRIIQHNGYEINNIEMEKYHARTVAQNFARILATIIKS